MICLFVWLLGVVLSFGVRVYMYVLVYCPCVYVQYTLALFTFVCHSRTCAAHTVVRSPTDTNNNMLVDGPHFQATDEGELIFLVSDGDSSRRPTEHDIMEPEEEEGTLRQNYYLHVPLDDPDSHRWRAEIAKYLAPLVLGST